MTAPADQKTAGEDFVATWALRAPGIAISAAVALAAYFAAPQLARLLPVPAIGDRAHRWRRA